METVFKRKKIKKSGSTYQLLIKMRKIIKIIANHS